LRRFSKNGKCFSIKLFSPRVLVNLKETFWQVGIHNLCEKLLTKFLLTSDKHPLNFLQYSFKLLTIIIQAFYEHLRNKLLMNILQTSYEIHTYFIWTSYEIHTNLTWTSYKLMNFIKLYMSFLQTSYGFLMNQLRTSNGLDLNLVWTWFELGLNLVWTLY
jgi:hypothetical protein